MCSEDKTEKIDHNDSAERYFPTEKQLRCCLQPAGGRVRRRWLQGWADCLSDTLRGLAQHSGGRPEKLRVRQKNKESLLQED